MILAALLFIARVAETTTVSQVTGDYVEDGRLHILQDKDIPYYATIFRIHGPFLFGATDKIGVITEKMHQLPPIVIIRLRNMTAIDATGLLRGAWVLITRTWYKTRDPFRRPLTALLTASPLPSSRRRDLRGAGSSGPAPIRSLSRL